MAGTFGTQEIADRYLPLLDPESVAFLARAVA